jgi:hypothetical protein
VLAGLMRMRSRFNVVVLDSTRQSAAGLAASVTPR